LPSFIISADRSRKRQTLTMDLAAKLQVKPGDAVLFVLAPSSIAPALSAIPSTTKSDDATALLVFVQSRAVLEGQRNAIVESATRDQLTWVAYPKSGQLETDLNRDSLAALLIERGVRPVRQIALDDVWSALRFRPDS
jgi:hypothetical protein